MKFIISLLALLTTASASAVTCEATCTYSNEDIVATVSYVSYNTYPDVQDDFDASCDSKGGHVSNSYQKKEVKCSVLRQGSTSVSGYGDTLFDARQDARTECRSYGKNYSSVGNFVCDE